MADTPENKVTDKVDAAPLKEGDTKPKGGKKKADPTGAPQSGSYKDGRFVRSGKS